MSFEMMLWKVAGANLQPVSVSTLDQEQRLEDWIAADPSILGMELAIIGRQVQTAYGGRIDSLRRAIVEDLKNKGLDDFKISVVLHTSEYEVKNLRSNVALQRAGARGAHPGP